MVPPTLHYLKHDDHLPALDIRFGSQYYHLKQPKKTLAYAKALQHWAEVAKSTLLDEPCQLTECVKELRKCMGLLTTYMDEEALANNPLSPWVMVTSS